MVRKKEVSDASSELLISDEDEDYYPPLRPSGQVTKPQSVGQASDGESISPVLDLDLQDMCKHAAAKPNIQWPEVQAVAGRSRYYGKKLPKAKRTGKQLLPFFPELEELAVSWRNKPYREKHPVAGSSVLDCEEMENCGLRQMPPVEAAVATKLHLKLPF